MTLVISWVRKVGSNEELCVASDSRLTCGYAWDSCPKIKIFERGDSVLAFSGSTEYSYPMMEQINTSINMYPKYKTRVADIADLKGHILRVLTNMREYMHNSIEPGKRFVAEKPSTNFIFAGYSWLYRDFKIWKFKFDQKENAFVKQRAHRIGKSRIMILVDAANHLKEKRDFLNGRVIRDRIIGLMESRGKIASDPLDMEPFEILRNVIRNKEDWSIGGAPQLIKIYRHLNVLPIGVFWPNKESKQITFLGRPLLNYEILRRPVIDPDTLEYLYMRVNNSDFDLDHDDGRFERHREVGDL